MKKVNRMIDLETLGVGPLAAILSIGWCDFNESEIAEPDEIAVDVESCVKAGMRIKDSTFRWWLRQEVDARSMLQTNNPLSLHDALIMFSETFTGDEVVWGNGSNFDIAILEVAFELCDIILPWKFWNVGCYRTLKNEAKHVPKVKPVIPHCAASDAEAQAIHLQNIWKARGQ